MVESDHTQEGQIIHLKTPINSRSVPIQRLHWRKTLRHDQTILKDQVFKMEVYLRYDRFYFNYFFPYHDRDPDDATKNYDEHVQPDEPQEVNPSVTIPVHTPTPIKIQYIYI